MPISTLTDEKVAKLMQEHELKAELPIKLFVSCQPTFASEARELRELQKKKPADLWLEAMWHFGTPIHYATWRLCPHGGPASFGSRAG